MVTVSVLMIGCRKDADGLVRAGITGKWQWEQSYGGIGVHTVTPSAGTMVRLILSEDHTYTLEKNGQLVVKDAFTVHQSGGVLQLEFANLVAADKLQMHYQQNATIENGKLVLVDANVSDGFAHRFVINN